MKVLYIEDNPTALEYVRRGLLERGFLVDVASTGEEGLERALEESFDLLVLDVILPETDGFELLRELRARGVETPALFLSARVRPTDRIQGLNLGADDYLCKPFAFEELVARIRAITRRAAGTPAYDRLQVADLVLDTRRHRVERAGKVIELTPKEFSLLSYLMQNSGQALSRAMITEKVWGYEFESYSNLIEVHINHLRNKIDHGRAPRLIHTVKGVGYVLEDRGSADALARGAAIADT
jgi:two-component system copper resistance phosphate regulon response regulator CusR